MRYDYWQFHVVKEQERTERTHQSRYADGELPNI
jgi:hypothetical protein